MAFRQKEGVSGIHFWDTQSGFRVHRMPARSREVFWEATGAADIGLLDENGNKKRYSRRVATL